MRSVATKLMLVVLGVVLAIGLVEVGGRLNPNILPQRIQDATRLVGTREIGEFARLQASVVTGDPYLGIHLKPGVRLFLRGHPDYSYHITTSELDSTAIGIRGPAVVGQPFAVAVGDSHTFGAGSEVEDVWVSRLSLVLGEQVVNLGLPSASSIQYTRMYEQYGSPLRPRIVIWEAYAGDFLENVWFDTWLQNGGGRFYDWKIWANKVATSGRLGRMAALKKWLDSHSITFNLVKLVVAGVGYHYRSETMDIIFGRPFHFSMKDPDTARGWRLMEKAMLHAQAIAKRQGARLVVVYFPQREEVYAPLLRGKFAVGEKGLGVPQQMLRTLAAQHGFDLLDLTVGMAAHDAAGEQLYFRQDGHFNKRGNDLVALLIAQYLRQAGLVPARTLNP